MCSSGKHVCTLAKLPSSLDIPPTAGCCQRLLHKIRQMMLPCEWHHCSIIFIRSQKQLRLERKRQLQSRHWLVWHPYSPIRFFWDCFDMIISTVAFMYIPLQVFFNCPNPYNLFILFVDFTAFLNIITQFITGYNNEDNKKVTLEPAQIAKHYIRGSFFADLIGALPLQVIQQFENCKYPSHTIFFVFKLFRLVSLRAKWKNIHNQLDLSYMHTVLITVLARVVLFFHWMTYIHYQVPAFCAHYYKLPERTTQALIWLKRFKVVSKKPIFEKYTTNLYHVCGLCVGAGYYSPIDQHVIPEMLLTSCMGIIGLVFLTYCFMALLRLAMYGHYQTYLYNGRLKELQQYMISKRLPKYLQHKVMLFMNYKFNGHYFNEDSIMSTINEQIKQDINMHCCRRLVVNVPLFKNMPDALINTIMFNLTPVLYMPGETVVKYGHPGNAMHFISSGTVAVINSAGKEITHLNDGAFYGEQTLLRPGSLRTATIIALEITEIYTLKSESFQWCIQPYPHLKRRLEASEPRAAPPPRPRRASAPGAPADA